MIRTLLWSLCFVFLLSAVAQAAPVMMIAEPEVTLKEPVMEGEAAKGEFIISNQGDAELIIESVSPG